MDRDYVKTHEDLIFMIIGNRHLHRGYISSLKYIPGDGPWHDDKSSYCRILKKYYIEDVKKTYDYLKKYYPKYLYFHGQHQSIYQLVKEHDIKNSYSCKNRLRDIIENRPENKLEKKTCELVTYLSKVSSIPISHFGVTGSILLGIHNESFSDIDLVVYGKENGHLLLETLKTYCNGNLRLIDEKELIKKSKERSKYLKIPPDQILFHEKRKHRLGYYKNTYFSISFVLEECSTFNSDTSYKKIAPITIEADITSSDQSIITPAKYTISNVKIVDGPNITDIKEIVSFDSNFLYQAFSGERVFVEGLLEEVTIKKEVFHRILLGSLENSGNDKIYVV